MLPPDVRRGSNDVRSGARRYYKELVVEEHSHVLVISPATCLMTHKQVLLKEKTDLILYLYALGTDTLLHCTDSVPMIACVESDVC